MNFAVARPDVVQAINQRWLINFWKRHLGQQQVPQWQAVGVENLAVISSNLSFLDVIGSGATIGQVYGSGDCRGRYLDEIIPPARHAEGLAPYRHAINSGRPVYTIHDMSDCNGRLVHYERLLMPFAADGRNVDRILASFELVCEDGAFDSQAIMISQSAPPALRLAVTIELPATA
jgi:hypothetical protein